MLVVGLACARTLARSGREVVLVDAAAAVGTGTSSRNSEVIHAGLYYPEGSRKAHHCLRGSEMLRSFCKERDIQHRICGKLIVATSAAQRGPLEALRKKAEKNGVPLERLRPEEVKEMEPEVFCLEALHSPRTGIIDSHGFMQVLLADAEDFGASLALKTRLRAGSCGNVVRAEFEDESGGAFQIEALEAVNCGGLAAPRLARQMAVPQEALPTPHFCRGSYYALPGLRPFSRLVYPMPEPNTSGLGVHATVDLQGQVRFGPDVEWLAPHIEGMDLDEVAYSSGPAAAAAYHVDTARASAFYEEVRRYWPGLPDDALVADYCGLRPKLSGPGEPAADFQLLGWGFRSCGRPSLLNLLGIESPGLTAALSLAEEVLQLLGPPPSQP
ncbi:unnamed protein product [Effrenium voratum]|nr:unnamed protein product [Effrenium voratum]